MGSDHPDRLWVADVIYVRTWAGLVYVAFVVDVVDAVATRSSLYRAMHSSHTLRTRMLANAYFRLQRAA